MFLVFKWLGLICLSKEQVCKGPSRIMRIVTIISDYETLSDDFLSPCPGLSATFRVGGASARVGGEID